MTRPIALAGDWHGNWSWANARLMSLASRGVRTVLHLGDFGVWPGPSGRDYVATLEKVCAKHDMRLYVVPGNHEDWARLLSIRPETRDEMGALWWLTDHIAVFPRDPAGHRFAIDGRTFVALGGAPSLDFQWRVEGETWWAEEMLPRETAEQVAADGYADVMLTHDAPGDPWQTPRVAQICGSNDFGWTNTALAYAAQGRQRLTTAFLGVRPRLLVHGHFHVADETVVALPDADHGCRIVSLANDEKAGNVALLDTETLSVDWLGARP